MFVKIDNFICKCVKSGKQLELVSKNEDAIKYGFKKDGKIYYKNINSILDINEAYDIKFWIEYETNFEKVANKWDIKISKDSIVGNTVKLVFAEGYLPGWKVEEKGICSNYIPIEKIKNIVVEYRYYRRFGIDDNTILKNTISSKEFIKLFHICLNV